MPLTSASTTPQVEAAYDDNSDYWTDSTGQKAKDFIQACTILIRRYNDAGASQNQSFQKKVADLREERKAAKDWADANGVSGLAGPRVVLPDFSDFRG